MLILCGFMCVFFFIVTYYIYYIEKLHTVCPVLYGLYNSLYYRTSRDDKVPLSVLCRRFCTNLCL